MNVLMNVLRYLIMAYPGPTGGTGGWKASFKEIVLAIIVLVVGAVAAAVASGVGVYILQTLNGTAIKIPANYNYVSPIAGSIGSVFEILIVVIIVIALFYVIRLLMRSSEEM